MGFFRKRQQPAHLQGRMTDLQQAQHLATKQQWSEALGILDGILALPEEAYDAAKHLRSVMKDGALLGLDVNKAGRDASGDWVMKGQFTIGGGFVPIIMDIRGQCIFWMLQSAVEELAVNGNYSMTDREFGELVVKGHKHAAICSELFWDEPNILAYAGAICAITGVDKPALDLLERALTLAPEHPIAMRAISVVRQRKRQP